MKWFYTTLLLILCAPLGATTWHLERTHHEQAQELLALYPERENISMAVFDVGFYGHSLVVPDFFSADFVVTEHQLFTPHGASVASLLAHESLGGSSRVRFTVFNTGIYAEDFARGVALMRERSTRLVNASLGLRDDDVAEVVNRAAEEDQLIFVLSSGNSAARLGRGLQPRYHGLKAIIVSCLDQNGEVADFAQLDSSVTVLAPCGLDNIPSLGARHNGRVHDDRGYVREPRDPSLVEVRSFGQTSAGAPQVAAAIADVLSLAPDLTLTELRELLRNSATETVEFEGVHYPILNRYELLRLTLRLTDNERS